MENYKECNKKVQKQGSSSWSRFRNSKGETCFNHWFQWLWENYNVEND